MPAARASAGALPLTLSATHADTIEKLHNNYTRQAELNKTRMYENSLDSAIYVVDQV